MAHVPLVPIGNARDQATDANLAQYAMGAP